MARRYIDNPNTRLKAFGDDPRLYLMSYARKLVTA